MNIESICLSIARGELSSDDLNRISRSIRMRSEHLSQIKFFSLKIGDKVIFNNKTRPTYLIGAKATVSNIRTKKVEVTLENPVGRFRGKIITSTGLIDKVS